MITTLPEDADNLYIVLTAKGINPKLKIISRASNENSDFKLKRAGANNVIMPDRVGGQRMAKLVTQPDVAEFIDFIMLQEPDNVFLEELTCEKLASCFDGRVIKELDIRNQTGANIIGLRKADRSYIINPSHDVILSSSDKLFVLGTVDQINQLKTFSPKKWSLTVKRFCIRHIIYLPLFYFLYFIIAISKKINTFAVRFLRTVKIIE